MKKVYDSLIIINLYKEPVAPHFNLTGLNSNQINHALTTNGKKF